MMQSLQENKANTAKLSRVLLLVTLDILVCNVVAFLALWIRHEFSLQGCIDSGFLDTYARWAIPNTLAVLALFAAFKLYMTLWSFAGAEEMARIFVAAVTIGILQMLLVLLKLAELPRSFPVLFAMMLFIATVIVRFSYRFIRRLRLHLSGDAQSRTMVIGAGEAGALILREFKRSRFSKNKVVCLVDDDPLKKGRQLMGVPIVGGRDQIVAAVDKYGITEIVLAIPTLSPKVKKEIWEICSKTGCKFKQMPGIYQLANGEVSIQAIRDIDIEDLLERDVVKVDMGGLSDLIRGRTVMVTGGGGSIGSELCRQLAGPPQRPDL